MRKVVDGKIYDTETAEVICDISPAGFHQGDFKWEDTCLYKSKAGTFFIAGGGGAYSRWAVSLGDNGRGPGSGLQVLAEAEARTLCEQHGSPDDYERAFGKPEEG